ncbi:hypothetical protein [Mesomycoplasma ovipneumoniae]|uniref:hypothetical protein n=1 Tax=Mesomycoplasma ovipneumoniae TaxID=29562 RepID=UPI0030802997
MNKKLKLFKFIVNIITFSLLSLSVFSSLWHFQNKKTYSDFKLTTRDLDLLNPKKPLNFADLAQIF